MAVDRRGKGAAEDVEDARVCVCLILCEAADVVDVFAGDLFVCVCVCVCVC